MILREGLPGARPSGLIASARAHNNSAKADGRDAPGVTERDLANAIRALAMDAVEAAKSGHPGMPMGMADAATVLFSRFLAFDPAWPDWPARDRFLLSAGHGSMLLYGLLYLTGYANIGIEQIKRFRQLGSRTPGHPEVEAAAGIETTTGPLGQGLANAVGMALAERHLAAQFGEELMGHFTYVVAGDGCLMEGISQEAISFAGHHRLGKLIVLYDDNGISIDGPTALTASDDARRRFEASGWHTDAVDGHYAEAVAAALGAARETEQPSLIVCRTVIGFGAPTKQGTAATHGAPLGPDEVAAARQALGWPAPPFEIPDDILAAWRAIGARGAAASAAWRDRLNALDGGVRAELERRLAGRLPDGFRAAMAVCKGELFDEVMDGPQTWATRKSSGRVLEAVNAALPEVIGGSADLTDSNLTHTPGLAKLTRDDYAGRYIHYGVREHAMAAIMNGLALHGGVIPYGGTFLVFTDYMRPALRLSALMRQRVIYVMTHDSIGLGEDGPTHQPVEHLAALRAIPGLAVFRPADAVETVECWELALAAHDRPSVLALTRQGVPPLRSEHGAENLCARGAYVLADADAAARVTLLATGSEVCTALAAREMLQATGTPTRVVSMPCQELFDAQDESYRRRILGPDTVRVAVEAAVSLGWDRYIGENGAFVGMSSFGASAPGAALFDYFRITPAAVADAARGCLERSRVAPAPSR